MNKCTCKEGNIEVHPCPYAEELRGQIREFNEPINLCKCCDYCMEHCVSHYIDEYCIIQ